VRRRWLLVAAAATAVAAAGTATIAHDAQAWRDALARGDELYAKSPGRADWSAATWLPGDPAARLARSSADVDLRRAVRLFVVASRTPRGFDAGETRARRRSAAQAALTAVATTGSPAASSQANDLLGVLAALGPRPDDALAVASFQAAVRADPSNVDAKTNLELALRRLQAQGIRKGPGNGSGQRSGGRRGAGSGTPGRGY
jgi:hypothetical protein